MGPRLGSRGKKATPLGLCSNQGSFNGAATWKSRKADKYGRYLAVLYELQWGRDLEVAESKLAS